jgi:tetratricopeptide (TPR) repeat protein
LGEILSRLGKTDEALAVFDAALEYARATDAITQARLYRRKGLAYNTARQMPEMFNNYAQASTFWGPPPTPDPAWQTEWLELQLDYAWAYYFSNRVAELNELIAAVGPIIEQAGSPEQRIRFYETNCLADFRRYRFYRLPDETLARMKRQLAAAEAMGNRRAIGRAKTLTGFVHLWRDELDEAKRWFEDSFKDVEHVGDMDSLIIARSYIALVRAQTGECGGDSPISGTGVSPGAKAQQPFLHWQRLRLIGLGGLARRGY